MNYVCGFMMSYDLMQFLLIRKTHPEWQKGKLNGIGGKIEKKHHVISNPDNPDPDAGYWLMETPFEAMVREFHEETGITIARERWHCFHIEYHDIEPDNKTTKAKVYYFAAFGDEAKFSHIGENKDPLFEVVSSYKLIDLFFYKPEEVVYNIPYLIRMIIDCVRKGQFRQLNPEGVNSIP